ncbi:retrovirus-related pol polyprotein from transposon TNT 1-94 [Tanacetum coccineum]
MSQDVMIYVMNSTAIFGDFVILEMKKSESCNKCLDLEAELVKRKNMVEQDDKSCNNQNALEILEYFKNNDLKAQLQAKDTTICKLKEHIKSMRENNKEEKVKQEMDKIETIKIKLEHSVAKLLSENELLHKEIEHLKKIYKDQFDSIKKTRSLSKEHYESLIAQLNSKFMENADLKGQIQQKVFVITSLKNDLRKVKGKEIVKNAAQIPNAITIAPIMFKIDIEPLSHRLKNNRDAHEDYLKKTIENTDTIRRLVECARKQNPSEPLLDSACKFTKYVQELLVYVSQTCPRLKSSTSASRSQTTGNKENDRISQTPSSNMKNKVEVQLRRANLRSNKKNHVKDPNCDANVKHTMLNAISEIANNSESNHSWGSNATNVPSSSSLVNDSPMRVESINGKKYILVIVDDYSQFTWDKFLRSKDEAPDTIIKCIKNIQVRLNATVCNVKTDNRIEFVNQTLREFYVNVGISHQTSVARTPQQNDVVKRRNWILVEATRTM